MSGTMVADLGLRPETWLFLTLLSILTLFFKFSRIWTVRNLDLLLLFAPAPGLMRLVGSGAVEPWGAFAWLFAGSALWLARCLVDLGLSRRPLLEPNLNAGGLACVAIGMLGLLLIETIDLPVDQGAARNPADPGVRDRVLTAAPPGAAKLEEPVAEVLRRTPLPDALRLRPPQVVLSRVLASLGHLGLVAALIAIGARHFQRPILGLSVAVCYLLSPYTRIAVVDSGQILPAALIVTAILLYTRPAVAGLLIGLAGGWMPACLGLIPLWTGFYRRRGGLRFAAAAVLVALTCGVLGFVFPVLAEWALALGARSLAHAGLLPGIEAPDSGSFWTRIEPVYRLPVLIAYLALVITTALLPVEKNLGELIALSAALLVASQFWYLDEGGTHLLLYLPLVLLLIFRPNLNAKRALARHRTDRYREKSPVPDL